MDIFNIYHGLIMVRYFIYYILIGIRMSRIIIDVNIELLILRTKNSAEESLWQSSAKDTNVINATANFMI
jgi:hypothetical protein